MFFGSGNTGGIQKMPSGGLVIPQESFGNKASSSLSTQPTQIGYKPPDFSGAASNLKQAVQMGMQKLQQNQNVSQGFTPQGGPTQSASDYANAMNSGAGAASAPAADSAVGGGGASSGSGMTGGGGGGGAGGAIAGIFSGLASKLSAQAAAQAHTSIPSAGPIPEAYFSALNFGGGSGAQYDNYDTGGGSGGSA